MGPLAPAAANDHAAQQAKAEREKRADQLTAAVLAEEMALEAAAAAAAAAAAPAQGGSIGTAEKTGHSPTVKSKKD